MTSAKGSATPADIQEFTTGQDSTHAKVKKGHPTYKENSVYTAITPRSQSLPSK